MTEPGARVAVALAAVPALEGGAAGRVALAMLSGLAEHGVGVTALAARRPGTLDVDPPVGAGVQVVEAPETRTPLRIRLDAIRRPRGELAEGPFADRVAQAARESGVLHLEQVDAARLAAVVDVPVVLHLLHLARADRDLGAPWRPDFRQVAEFAAAERWAARRPAAFVASSPVVADFLRRHQPAARVVRTPLGLVPGHYPRVRLDGPPVAGLIGTAGWPPTDLALERLVTRLWPRIRARQPDAVLRIAGWGMAELDVLQDPGPGIEVVGTVDTTSGFLADLSLLLYPLPRGSGMKVKVLESMASGLPVITSRFGAEGLEPGDGVQVLDTDDEVVHAAVDLLADPIARRDRGQAAWSQFSRDHVPAVIAEPLAALYRELGA